MNRMITSGNQTVDEMVSVNITGNVTPTIWYRTILRANGKPHLLAIAMLSDIVYWYRPTEIRDEQTGMTIGWQKKFKGDFLQKSYSSFEDQFGETRRSVKLALNTLLELGVVRKFFRDVKKGDHVFYNTMFLDLIMQRLLEITFPDRYPSIIPYTEAEGSDEATFCNPEDNEFFEGDSQEANEASDEPDGQAFADMESGTEAQAVLDDACSSGSSGSVISNGKVGTSTYAPLYMDVQTPIHRCTEGCTSMYPPLYTDVPTPIHECTEGCTPMSTGVYMNVQTNTKNTTEITVENTAKNTSEITTQTISSEMDGMGSIHPSIPETDETIKQMQADIASIRENIGYDWEMAHGNYRTRRHFQEMFNLMCDVICINEAYVNLGGARVPYFRVREKLLQITREHLVYVMDCMDKNSGSIGNIQAYTLKSIYNAPSSIDSYYAHEANHDLNYMG